MILTTVQAVGKQWCNNVALTAELSDSGHDVKLAAEECYISALSEIVEHVLVVAFWCSTIDGACESHVGGTFYQRCQDRRLPIEPHSIY